MALRFALSVCNQYATNDINLGIDSTGQWEWIKRIYLIRPNCSVAFQGGGGDQWGNPLIMQSGNKFL